MDFSRPTTSGTCTWGKTTRSRIGRTGRRDVDVAFSVMEGASSPGCAGGLSRLLVRLSVDPDRQFLFANDGFVDDDLAEILLVRQFVHEVERQILDDRAQAAGAGAFLERDAGDL